MYVTGQRLRAASGALVLLQLVACGGGGPTHAPCDADGDCAEGSFCRSGVGCDFECRRDVDCAALGGTCDPARGRCSGARIDGGSTDAGRPDGATACTSDAQCADAIYCDGSERCVEGACVEGEPPCAMTECDESLDTCDSCIDPDRDDDGYDAVACGGQDCDDANPLISPSRREICDADGVDEDCNPATLGAVSEDSDGDGYWPPATPDGTPCCNGAVCGTDCADVVGPGTFAPSRYPGARETCNTLDDDCNDVVDDVSTWCSSTATAMASATAGVPGKRAAPGRRQAQSVPEAP